MSKFTNFSAPDYQWRKEGKGTMVHIFYKTSKLRERNETTTENRRTEPMEPVQLGRSIDIDAQYLKDFFEGKGQNLCFPAGATVVCKKLETFVKLEEILKKMDKPEEGEAAIGSTKYEKFDCFIFIFLTFTDKDGRLHFDDHILPLVPIEKVLGVVKKLKIAQGKPKVFMIQSDDLSLTEKKVAKKAVPTGVEPSKAVKIPSDADCIILRSTIPQSLVRGEKGKSLLVQAFVETIKENQPKQEDFLSLTTTIIEKVQNKIERLPDQDKLSKKLPLPVVMSTLTKFLNFHKYATV